MTQRTVFRMYLCAGAFFLPAANETSDTTADTAHIAAQSICITPMTAPAPNDIPPLPTEYTIYEAIHVTADTHRAILPDVMTAEPV